MKLTLRCWLSKGTVMAVESVSYFFVTLCDTDESITDASRKKEKEKEAKERGEFFGRKA